MKWVLVCGTVLFCIVSSIFSLERISEDYHEIRIGFVTSLQSSYFRSNGNFIPSLKNELHKKQMDLFLHCGDLFDINNDITWFQKGKADLELLGTLPLDLIAISMKDLIFSEDLFLSQSIYTLQSNFSERMSGKSVFNSSFIKNSNNINLSVISLISSEKIVEIPEKALSGKKLEDPEKILKRELYFFEKRKNAPFLIVLWNGDYREIRKITENYDYPMLIICSDPDWTSDGILMFGKKMFVSCGSGGEFLGMIEFTIKGKKIIKADLSMKELAVENKLSSFQEFHEKQIFREKKVKIKRYLQMNRENFNEKYRQIFFMGLKKWTHSDGMIYSQIKFSVPDCEDSWIRFLDVGNWFPQRERIYQSEILGTELESFLINLDSKWVQEGFQEKRDFMGRPFLIRQGFPVEKQRIYKIVFPESFLRNNKNIPGTIQFTGYTSDELFIKSLKKWGSFN